MLIALSGAQCTGKTTLLNELKKDPNFSQLTFVDEIVRSINKKGFKINEEGDDATQYKVMTTHLANTKLENAILDRCALDGMVYTQYLYNHHKIADQTAKDCLEIFDKCKDKYDVIFLLRPEFDIIPDGTRSTNKDFQDEAAKLFDSYAKQCLNVVVLHGSVEERLNAIYKTLKERELEC